MRRLIRNQTTALFEPLESRQLMSGATLGTNLIVNGDAEANTGASDSTTVVNPTGWLNYTGGVFNFSAVKYGTAGFLQPNDPAPTDRGNNFFAGGPSIATSIGNQIIDVSSQAIGIDAGLIKANLGAWLGGFSSDGDHVVLAMQFLDKDMGAGDSVSLPDVLAADRGNATSLIQKTASAIIPAGTRYINVIFTGIRTNGTYNDGYADDISLTLNSTAKTGFVTSSAFVDLDEDGIRDAEEKSLGGMTIYIDLNDNNTLDKGEPNGKTNKSGNVTISGVPRNKTLPVKPVYPTNFRVTSGFGLPITVHGGETAAGPAIGFTPFAIINGGVFTDNNSNGFNDGKEKDLGGVTVYLDFNRNGQLDPFESKTTTFAANKGGNFGFSIPFGTYVVRIIVPSGYKQTTGPSFTVRIGKGQFHSLDFGLKKV